MSKRWSNFKIYICRFTFVVWFSVYKRSSDLWRLAPFTKYNNQLFIVCLLNQYVKKSYVFFQFLCNLCLIPGFVSDVQPWWKRAPPRRGCPSLVSRSGPGRAPWATHLPATSPLPWKHPDPPARWPLTNALAEWVCRVSQHNAV